MFNPRFKPLSVAAALAVSAAASLTANPLVVGYERFHSQPGADLVEAGELLIGELGCASCHQVSGDIADRFPNRPSPRLEGIGQRANREWLSGWLESPHTAKASTVMPDLLAGRNDTERRRIADELTHFLLSLQPEEGSAKTSRGDPAAGRKLYHQTGCVACHEPDENYLQDTGAHTGNAALETPSIPLAHAPDKFNADGLAEFLINPLRHRPSARMPRVPLTAKEAADLAAYLVKGSSTNSPDVRPDASKASAGRAAFSRLGCAACHVVQQGGKPLENAAKAAPLSKIARSHAWGCLSATPIEGVPFYHLNDRQRAAIAAALHAIPDASQVSFAERSRKLMTALNCFACHQRDKIGGPADGRRAYFHTSGEDLEDEGRFPPTLTGVGRKLLPGAMIAIMQGKGDVRPYMTTRMPDFGEAHARELTSMLPTLDIPKDEKPTPRDGEENQVGRNMWGRALMGVKGLSCITCHDLKGKRSLGIRAMDLAHAPQRLRAEWFRDYLIDPAKFRPGTRMPAFWPGGKPLTKGNGSSTARQIDSIWAYLGEIDQSRLPEGMERTGDYELKPTDKPIVFRTFMESAGMHAIAIGHPQGVHAAFDAQNVHWSLFWKGAFLDAESTWDDRFTPLAKPLGESVARLEGSPGLNLANSAGKKDFGGFRLDENGAPTLLYRLAGRQIEDRLEPLAGKSGLRQTLTIKGEKGSFVFLLPVGDKSPKARVIEPRGAGPVVQLDSKKRGVPLELGESGSARMVIEWAW